MPRNYSVSFKNTTIAAVQDLVAMRGSTGKLCRLMRVWVFMDTTTLQAAQGLRLNVKISTATITLGSGGTAATPRKLDLGDAAASFTARVNDTTPATTSGAFTDLLPGGGHNYGGFTWNFGRDGPVFGLDQGVVFELLSTVSGTCSFSGGAMVSEEGL